MKLFIGFAIGLFLIPPAQAISLAGVAAVTTIAVNAGTIAKWVRHPKREAFKTAKQVKQVVKGRN